MQKDGLLTGLILGGLLGVTVSLLAVNAVKSTEKKPDDNDENNKQGSIQLKPLAENKEENKVAADEDDNNWQFTNNKGSTVSSEIDDTGNREEIPFNETSEETAEKPEINQMEMRDTKGEDKKKTEQEGMSMTEDIVSKFNFGEKIKQLEESLKKLREENTQ